MRSSGRDLILLAGGLFLLAKSTQEIHQSLEGTAHSVKAKATASFLSVLIQIAILDIIFSLDSVITAVGLADHLPVMILAIVIAVIIMMVSARFIGNFVDTHPTIKMLALSFLLLVGFSTHGGRARSPHPQRVYLFCHGFFTGSRNPESEDPGPCRQAGQAPQGFGQIARRQESVGTVMTSQ